MKQTAVEWLVNEIQSFGIDTKFINNAIEQAKEMEKQQIIDAYDKCYQDLSNTQKEVDKLATYISELPQQEISDEEINNVANRLGISTIPMAYFIDGAKWYKEQLKERQ